MNQSGVIFGALIVGFLIYITLKGELSTYAGLLLLPPKGSGTVSNTKTSSTSNTTQDVAAGITKGAISALGLLGG